MPAFGPSLPGNIGKICCSPEDLERHVVVQKILKH